MVPAVRELGAEGEQSFSPERRLETRVLVSYKRHHSWRQGLNVVLDDLTRHIVDERRNKLKTRCLRASFGPKVAPQDVRLAFSRLVQLKNLDQLFVVDGLFVDTPFLNEGESISEGLQNTAGHAVKYFLVRLLVLAGVLAAVLQLLVAEVKEHLESQKEYFWLVFDRESELEVSSREAADLRGRVEERAVPQRKDFLDVGPEPALGLADEARERVVGRLPDELVRLVEQDPAQVVQEECKQVGKLLRVRFNAVHVLLELVARLDLGDAVALLHFLENRKHFVPQRHH